MSLFGREDKKKPFDVDSWLNEPDGNQAATEPQGQSFNVDAWLNDEQPEQQIQSVDPSAVPQRQYPPPDPNMGLFERGAKSVASGIAGWGSATTEGLGVAGERLGVPGASRLREASTAIDQFRNENLATPATGLDFTDPNFLVQSGAEGAGSYVPVATGAAIGGAIGSAVLPVVGTSIGTLAGALITGLPMSFGEVAQKFEKETGKDIGTAEFAGYGGAHAVAEMATETAVMTGLGLLPGGKFLGKYIGKLAPKIGQAWWKTVAKGGVQGGFFNSLEEGVQSLIAQAPVSQEKGEDFWTEKNLKDAGAEFLYALPGSILLGKLGGGVAAYRQKALLDTLQSGKSDPDSRTEVANIISQELLNDKRDDLAVAWANVADNYIKNKQDLPLMDSDKINEIAIKELERNGTLVSEKAIKQEEAKAKESQPPPAQDLTTGEVLNRPTSAVPLKPKVQQDTVPDNTPVGTSDIEQMAREVVTGAIQQAEQAAQANAVPEPTPVVQPAAAPPQAVPGMAPQAVQPPAEATPVQETTPPAPPPISKELVSSTRDIATSLLGIKNKTQATSTAISYIKRLQDAGVEPTEANIVKQMLADRAGQIAPPVSIGQQGTATAPQPAPNIPTVAPQEAQTTPVLQQNNAQTREISTQPIPTQGVAPSEQNLSPETANLGTPERVLTTPNEVSQPEINAQISQALPATVGQPATTGVQNVNVPNQQVGTPLPTPPAARGSITGQASPLVQGGPAGSQNNIVRTRLKSEVRRAFGPVAADRVEVVDEPANISRELVNLLEEKTGRKIHVVRNAPFGGVHYGKDFIYVNEKDPRPILSIMGHELVHSGSPAATKRYLDALRQSADNAKLQEFYQQYRAQFEQMTGKKGSAKDFNDEYLLEEFGGDFMASQFRDPDFWVRLAVKTPKIFRELAIRTITWVKSLGIKTSPMNEYFKSPGDIATAVNAAVEFMDSLREDGAADTKEGTFSPLEWNKPYTGWDQWSTRAKKAGEVAAKAERAGDTQTAKLWRDRQTELMSRAREAAKGGTPKYSPQSRPPLGLYSKLEKRIEEAKNTSFIVKDLLGYINPQKSGVKAEEIADSGLEAFLKGKKSVTKDEVLEFLRNRPQLKEVKRGTLEHIGQANEISGDQRFSSWMHKTGAPAGQDYREALLTVETNDATEKYRQITARINDLFDKNKEGQKFPQEVAEEINRLVKEQERLLPLTKQDRPYYPPSGHLYNDESADRNRLTHRFYEKQKTSNGKEALVMREGQSDIHAEGREKGYGVQNWEPKDFKAENIGYKVWEVQNIVTGQLVGAWSNNQGINSAEEAIAKAVEVQNSGDLALSPKKGVPNLPHKKSWALLNIKRMIDDAVKQGITRVGWSTGDEVAERYSLRQVLSKIESSTPERQKDSRRAVLTYKDTGSTQTLIVSKDGKIIRSNGDQRVDVTNKETSLKDVIGGELAKDLMANDRSYEGEDIPIGGKWANQLYDNQLVNEVNDYLKPWGVKVKRDSVRKDGESSAGMTVKNYPEGVEGFSSGWAILNADGTVWQGGFTTKQEAEDTMRGDIAPIWSFDIPPALAESVREVGQPRYSPKELPIRGEYWWDGDIQFADGDSGDVNHEMVARQNAITRVLDALNIEVEDAEIYEIDAYEDEIANVIGTKSKQDLATQVEKYLEDNGKKDVVPAVSYAFGFGDAREYGVQDQGWIRIKGNNADVYGIDESSMRNVYKAFEDVAEAELDPDQDIDFDTVNVYDYKSKTYFSDVPLSVFKDGRKIKLREYTAPGARYTPLSQEAKDRMSRVGLPPWTMSREEYVGIPKDRAYELANKGTKSGEEVFTKSMSRGRQWDDSVTQAVVSGQLSEETAKAMGWRGALQANKLEPVPEDTVLYHATVDVARAMSGLKTEREAGRQGLGGGGGVSTTTDLDYAKRVAQNLARRKLAATGKAGELAAQIKRDHPKEYENAIQMMVQSASGSPTALSRYRDDIIKTLESNGKEGLANKTDDWYGKGKEKRLPFNPMDFFSQFFNYVEASMGQAGKGEWMAGGTYGTRPFKDANIGILELRPAKGALGEHFPAEYEWRFQSGKALVPIKRVEVDINPARFTPLQQEAKEIGNSTKSILRNMGEEVKKIINPTNVASPQEMPDSVKTMAGIVRAYAAEKSASNYVAIQKLKRFDKDISKLDDDQKVVLRDFFERETREDGTKRSINEWGQLASLPQETKDNLTQMSEIRRELIEPLWNYLRGQQGVETWIQDYFPHFWKNPKRAAAVIKDMMSKEPLQGSESFLKKRLHQYIMDGLANGLELESKDPIEEVLRTVALLNKSITAHEMKKEAIGQGIVVFSKKFGKDLPTITDEKGEPMGWTKLDDKIFKAQSMSKAGVTTHGEYWAPTPVARLFNNYLAPGLSGNSPWYDSARTTGNLLNSLQLGMSAFHAFFTTMDAVAGSASLGLQEIARGQRSQGFQRLSKAIITLPALMIGRGDIAQIYKNGKKMQEEFLSGVFSDPRLAKALVSSGGRLAMDEFYQLGFASKFKRARQNGDKIAGLFTAPFAAVEKLAYPIMEAWVPRLKVGMFSDMMQSQLQYWDSKGIEVTEEMIRDKGGEIWNSVENRMGQVAYDNLFWNKVFKDLAMVSVRSVGWNLGTLREFGGAGSDIIQAKKRIKKIDGGYDIPPRVAYAVAMPFVVGLIGAIIHKLGTGEPPEEAKDYFFPKTGKTRPDGEPERLSVPSYMKDIYPFIGYLAEKEYGKIGTMASHKMHPAASMAIDFFRGYDYFGTEIRDPADEWTKQVQDAAKYIGTQMQPFSIQGGRKALETAGDNPLDKGTALLKSFVGLNPAPKYVTMTKADAEMNKYYERTRDTGISRETMEDRKAKSKMMQMLRQHKPGEARAFAREQGFTPEEYKRAEKRSKLDARASSFKNINDIDSAMKVIRKANPEEFRMYRPILQKKIDNSTVKTPEEKRALRRELLKLSSEINSR